MAAIIDLPFKMDMDEEQLRDVLTLWKLKSDAESVLMNKSDIVALLNENANKEFVYQPSFPILPPSTIVDLDRIDISFTKSIPFPSSDGPSRGTETKADEGKGIADEKSVEVPQKFISDAYRDANEKSNELVQKMIKSSQHMSLGDKKKELSKIKKDYNTWFEKYVSEFFEKHCGTTSDTGLIGTGKKLQYDIKMVNNIRDELHKSLLVAVRIPIDNKHSILLTPAKQEKLKLSVSELYIEYAYYCRYVEIDKTVSSKEMIEKLLKSAEEEITSIGFKKGSKNLMISKIKSYHGYLVGSGTPIDSKHSKRSSKIKNISESDSDTASDSDEDGKSSKKRKKKSSSESL